MVICETMFIFISVCVCVCMAAADSMNQEVLILFAVFVVGAVATLVRTILFNLAGERFVARLRKNVSQSRKARTTQSLYTVTVHMWNVIKHEHTHTHTHTHTALCIYHETRYWFL